MLTMRVFLSVVACSLAILISSSNSYPQPQPKAENKPTTQDKRGTQESPLIIHGDITTKAAEKSESERQQEEIKIEIEGSLAKYTGIAAGATGGLVAVTAVLAWFTYRLWKATNKLVVGADNTAKHELRTYMGVKSIQVREIDTATPLRGVVTIANFGKTMAKDLEFWITGVVEDVTLQGFPWGDRKLKTAVMPGERMMFEEPIRFGKHDLEMMEQGSTNAILWGKITYTDVFGKNHWTIFRFVTYEREGNGWKTRASQEGNDAGEGEPPLPLTS